MSKPKVNISHQMTSYAGPKANLRDEGYKLPMQRKVVENGAVSFGLDITKAPVPQRRYASELCDVKFADGDVRFLFAQMALAEDALDSVLVVRMNLQSVHHLVGSIDSMEGVQAIADRWKIPETPLVEISRRPAQMASVVANFAAIAVAGYETCIDFYHASAFAMLGVTQTNASEIAVEPVVRVDIQTRFFLSWCSALRQIAADNPQP